MPYLELLKLSSPEAILVVTVLCVLGIGLTDRANTMCSLTAIIGVAVAAAAIFLLPKNATLFGGMLVISPLNSFFKIICLGLAAFAVFLANQEQPNAYAASHRGEYLAMMLLATIGLMLLVGSEEL